MHLLERISLANWNLLVVEDIEIREATALIGSVGVGKSSILDAIQTVVTGNQKRRLGLNRAAGADRSKRTVLEYCLGKTEETIADGSYRRRCESILVLSFRDEESRIPVCFGLVLDADETEPREQTVCRFVAEGVSFSFERFAVRHPSGVIEVPAHQALLARLEAENPAGYRTYNTRAEAFIEAYLTTMRRRGAVPDVNGYLVRFKNAIAFEEIADPTEFVRRYVLDEDPINVERIRLSIETWRELAAEVKRIEAMLAEAQRVRTRFERFARQTIETGNAEFQEVLAERLRLEAEVERLRQAMDAATAALAEAQRSRAYYVREIEAARDAIARKSALIAESGVAAGLHALELRETAARDERARALVTLGSILETAGEIAGLEPLKPVLPMSVHAAIGAARIVRRERAAILGGTAAMAAVDVAELVGQVAAAHATLDRLNTIYDDHVARRAAAQAAHAGLREQLGAARSGGAFLSSGTLALMRDLRSQGIEPIALPDAVEIAPGEERWARAVEMVLGAYREAILVREADQDAAFDLLYRKRGQYHRCRLINTRKTARSSRTARPGAIVEIVRTDLPDIRRFLDAQFGHIQRAETSADLDRLDNAIMDNGKTSQGLGLRVHETDFQPILGRTAQEDAMRELAGREAALAEELRELSATVQLLQQAIRCVGDLERIDAMAVHECYERIASAERAVAAVAGERRAVESDEVKGLREQIDGHKADLADHESEIREGVDPAIEQATRDRLLAETRRQTSEEAVADKRREEARIRESDAEEPSSGYRVLLADAESFEQIEARLRNQVSLEPGRAREILATARDEARRLAQEGRRSTAAERSLASELGRYLQAHPGITADVNGMSRIEQFRWIIDHINRLELHELRPYRDNVDRAKAEMEAALKEDLLTKLHDKLNSVRDQLDVLNKRLARHRFTGQTYFFSRRVNAAVSKLHRLAERVALEPARAGAIVSGDHADPITVEAMQQIEEILARDQDTHLLEDYRQYYTFELNMTPDEVSWADIRAHTSGDHGEADAAPADGDARPKRIRITGTLTDRTSKGSGGQKQTPYYVAIAASMAAAYYPSSVSERPDGMGLVCFDEAFSKLDIQNTQALIAFFRELNLQILVAAPEEKRTSFMELMDTIVNIAKVPGEPVLYIDTEHPGERARRELRDANPDRIGIEGYRRLVAEGSALAATALAQDAPETAERTAAAE